MTFRRINRRMFRTVFHCISVWTYQGQSGRLQVSIRENVSWRFRVDNHLI